MQISKFSKFCYSDCLQVQPEFLQYYKTSSVFLEIDTDIMFLLRDWKD